MIRIFKASIKSKITSTVFLLIALILAALTVSGYYYVAGEFKDEIAKQHFSMLSLAADQLDDQVVHSQEMLLKIAKRIDAEKLADPSLAQAFLDDETDAQPFFDGGFLILDANGLILAESPSHNRRGTSLLFRDYAKAIITKQPVISAPYPASIPPYHPTVTFSVPIFGPNGKVAGVLAGRHDLLHHNYLSDMGAASIGKSGYFYLLDKKRTLIMHPDKHRILEQVKPGSNRGVDAAIDRGFSGTMEITNSKGVGGIASFTQLKHAGWIMASHYPLTDAHAALDRVRYFLGAAFIVILIVSLVIVWFVTDHIAAPLVRLIEHVRTLPAKKDDERLITLETGDELELLSEAFNGMVRKMDDQRQFAESLLENTSTPLFVIDADHKVNIWNRAMTELTGRPAAEVVGTTSQWQSFYGEIRPTLCDLVLDERIDEVDAYYTHTDKDTLLPGNFRAEGWYKNLNGKDRFLFFDAAPIRRNGKIVAVVETLQDITERKRAEDALRLFSQAVDQSASSIVITGTTGSIEYVNHKFCEVTGYCREEAIGKNPRILKSDQQSAEIYEKLWQTVASGKPWHGELHNKRKDGTLFWEIVTITPIINEEGTITHHLGVKEDITERKNAERKLLKKQAELVLKHEQLSNLFKQVELSKREWEETMDCIDDMIILVDANNNIRRCNQTFAKLTGIAYEQLLSSKWSEVSMTLGFSVDDNQELSGEFHHQKSNRWFDIRTYPYEEANGAVITFHDLTEIRKVSQELASTYEDLKSTHQQLLQNEKLASIGQLAAGVAHEINNPMGFISSNLGTMSKYLVRLEEFIKILSQAIQDPVPAHVQAEIATARQELKVNHILADAHNLLAESTEGAERVKTIVQNLKTFSRVDEAESKYADLHECLESTIMIAWNELKYKVNLIKEYGELPQVKCHPQQLNQVFLNMMINAAHAIDKQGAVTIRTWTENKNACIAISDTGSGIPEEILNRIFEPFFTTKEVGKGTGLGLSISYDIINKHHGTIGVDSKPGNGTTFTIRLPIEG